LSACCRPLLMSTMKIREGRINRSEINTIDDYRENFREEHVPCMI
jgi:hypothetical protein